MIPTLGALLETVAVLAAASLAASLVVGPALGAVRRLPVAPAARADLALLAAALPAGAVMVVAVAVALPGALDLAGLVNDHCGEHGGHGHLCIAHPNIASVALVALGALCLAVTVLRWGSWLTARVAAARDLGALLRLGTSSGEGPDVVRLDGNALLCHAAGAFFPRVLVSTRLLAALPPELLSAALEHERAHVRRRDVLARDLLTLLGFFGWPGLTGGALRTWEEAAEEAADAEAAERVGGPVLARALVAVSRLSLTPTPSAMPLAAGRLTRRVEVLLDRPPVPRPARALLIIPVLGLGLLGLAALGADPLHHAAETTLHWLLAG